VHIQNLLTATNIRQRHDHLAIETTRAHQGGIKHIRPVGRSDHDNAGIAFKAVHLNQHLVQGLFALVIAAAQTCATLTANRVNFVDEDDAWRTFLGLIEHVTHTRRAHADKHFHEVRTRNREERYFGLTGNRLGEQGFTCTRRADHQDAARHTAAQTLVFGWIAQIIHNFSHFGLGFIATGDIDKGHAVIGLVEHARLGLAKTERATFAAALHLAHEEKPYPHQKQHREPVNQQFLEETW